MASSNPEDLSGVMDALAEAETNRDTGTGSGTDSAEPTVSIGQMLDQFDRRSFGPLLLIVAILAVGPTGAIPGMSVITGTLVILVSIQILLGFDHAWVPGRIERITIPQQKLKSLVERAKPVTRTIDRFIGRRWALLVDGPAHFIIAIACIALAGLMFPLALLPFAVAVPGTAIGLFALAMTARDGVLALLGYAVTAGAVWLALTLVS